MSPYRLVVTAECEVRGRDAEAICRAIGIEPVDNELKFEFYAEAALTDARVDDVVPPDENVKVVRLRRRDLMALRPGDYVAHPLPGGQLRIAAAAREGDPGRLLEIHDAVAGPRAERERCGGHVEDRVGRVFEAYRRTFNSPDSAVAYQILADLVEHFKPSGFDVRACLDEAIRDVESGVFTDGVAS